ncbi:MAG TPA: TIM-barrel domain-containing protein [Mycobacteriales bacterium]|nr:TIM-barrel domain-containing protein [Mycobacteriales bacterium]
MNRVRLACLAALVVGLALIPTAASGSGPNPVPNSGPNSGPNRGVQVGHARFEVLSPTLIRIEYAPDGHFENRPTAVAQDRSPITAFTTTRAHGVLTIRTAAIELTYRIGGRFTTRNVAVRSRHGQWSARPDWSKPGGGAKGNLGGWIRALDDRQGPVPLHGGLLTRAGWYLLNDSTDALLTAQSPGFAIRRTAAGYQDGYLFGYGRHFATALRDLRTLTGPAPLLPRPAFGVWFSRYYAYDTAQYAQLLNRFRVNRVPLDTLSIDTDWKRQPNPISPTLAGAVVGKTQAWSWNGWEWNTTLFPHPRQFVAWMHRHGVALALNIHPSIDSTDPQYDATVAKTGPLQLDPMCTLQQIDPLGQCHVFDLTQPNQIAAYFALHAPITADGVDEWWLDWCCDATSATAPGLTPDTWLNRLYTNYLHRDGDRWLVLSRVGGSHQGDDPVAGPGPGIFAEHRYAIHFTGDTCATWGMLGFEAKLSAEEGNVGIPYVSHDIGSFNGAPIRGQCSPSAGASGSKLPAQMYARWVQLGVFQPLLRLHSNHGARLPWEYTGPARQAATAALQMRESLVPYLYSVARESYDTGLPMMRALYLQWPGRAPSYRHPQEFTMGRDVLVRPVAAKGNPAPAKVWFPPGRWVDYFTGKTYAGPSVHSFSVPLSRMPVFVRAGSVVPTQPPVAHSTATPRDHLCLTVYGDRDGSGRLYDDAGTGFGYQHRAYSWIRFRHTTNPHGQALRISAASDDFADSPTKRSWTVRFRDVFPPPPRDVIATVAGHRLKWRYDEVTRTLTVRTPELSTTRAWTVRLTSPSVSGSQPTA